MNAASYLIKQALGSIIGAQATHPFSSSVFNVPNEGLSLTKRQELDKLVSQLPPGDRRIPVRAGTQRLIDQTERRDISNV